MRKKVLAILAFLTLLVIVLFLFIQAFGLGTNTIATGIAIGSLLGLLAANGVYEKEGKNEEIH